MEISEKFVKLRTTLKEIYYKHKGDLLFHGWHHVNFVSKKSKGFAEAIEADAFIAESSALVHDLNYLAKKHSRDPGEGQEYRKQLLLDCGYTDKEIERIESIIKEADGMTRGEEICDEAKALSDADTLFKSLPFTTILFSSKYIQQQGIDIAKLADQITSEQNKLLDEGIYFYTDLAKEKYLHWARANLGLWSCVKESLEDPDIAEVIQIAKELEVL